MSELDKDLKELLSAARNAATVLRHAAEQLEIEGRDSHAERDAVRRLNMAIQLVEYDLSKTGDSVEHWDWRQL